MSHPSVSAPHAHLVLEDGGDMCTVEVCARATNRSELLRHGGGGGPDARRRPLELRRGVRYALEPGDRLRLGLLECSVVFGEAYLQQQQGQEQQSQGLGQQNGTVPQQEVSGPSVAPVGNTAGAGAGSGAAANGGRLGGAEAAGGGVQASVRVSMPPTQELADGGVLQPPTAAAGATAAAPGAVGAHGAGVSVAVEQQQQHEQQQQGVSHMVQVVMMAPGGQLVSLPVVAGPGGLTLLEAPPGIAGQAVAADAATAAATAAAAGMGAAPMQLPLPLPLGGVGGILGVLPPQAAALAGVPGAMPPPHLAATAHGLGVGPAGEQLPARLPGAVPPVSHALVLEALRLQQQQQGALETGHIQGQEQLLLQQQQYLSLGSSGTSESGVSETPEGTQQTQQGAVGLQQQATPMVVVEGVTGSAGGAAAAGPDGAAPAGGASTPGVWWDGPDSMDDVHYGAG